MPFQPGNKLAKGGYHGGGRPSKKQLADLLVARAAVEKRLAADAVEIYNDYRRFTREDPATCRDAIHQILGDGNEANQGQSINVNLGFFTKEPGSEPQLRTNSIQIHTSGNNGKNGNGSDGA